MRVHGFGRLGEQIPQDLDLDARELHEQKQQREGVMQRLVVKQVRAHEAKHERHDLAIEQPETPKIYQSNMQI